MRRDHHGARVVALVAGALLLSACGGEPLGPAPACQLPATTVDAAAIAGISGAGLHAAALDASERLVMNVNSGAAGSSLTSAVASLDQGMTAGDAELACRGARNALATLDGLAADSASAPDRSALRLVIELMTATLGEE